MKKLLLSIAILFNLKSFSQTEFKFDAPETLAYYFLLPDLKRNTIQ